MGLIADTPKFRTLCNEVCATLEEFTPVTPLSEGGAVRTRSIIAGAIPLGLVLSGLLVAPMAAATSSEQPSAPAGSSQPEVLPDSETVTVPGARPVVADSDTVPLEAASGAQAAADGLPPAPTNEVQYKTISTEGGNLRVVGVTWNEIDAGADLTVQLRSLVDGAWTDWQAMEITSAQSADEAPDGSRGGTEPMVVVDAQKIEVALAAPADAMPTDPEISVIDPGESPADGAAPVGSDVVSGGAGAGNFTLPSVVRSAAPRIFTRADWGADESIRTWRPQLGEVTGVVVHHSAGANGYPQNAVPGIIRGIYQYHAVTRGWGDIGYNVIVDRFGRAWEGRYGGVANAVIGAHASGVNGTMFGISVLGDYDKVAVPDAAFQTVARVTAWKFANHGISTSGTGKGKNNAPISRVVGHRDVGSTACPGRYFYPRLGELKNLITSYQSKLDWPPNPGYETVRLAGSNRYTTSVAASRWANSWANTVFVATGTEFADALTGGPAAATLDGPVLLVKPDEVPADVEVELRRLKPRTIFVLGGSGAISNGVVSQLKPYADTVQRLSGNDRYETARAVSRAVWSKPVGTVYIAGGHDFADALASGAAAAKTREPLFLTRTGTLPTPIRQELERLRPAKVVVLGGTAVVSDTVVAQVRAAVPGVSVVRIGGTDRYDTAAKLAQAVWPTGASTAYFATGRDFPDALSGVPTAGDAKAPMLLVRGWCADTSVRRAVDQLKPSTRVVVGGTGVVRDGAITQRC